MAYTLSRPIPIFSCNNVSKEMDRFKWCRPSFWLCDLRVVRQTERGWVDMVVYTTYFISTLFLQNWGFYELILQDAPYFFKDNVPEASGMAL